VGDFTACEIIWQCVRRELGKDGVEELCCPTVIRCVSSRKPEENTKEASNDLGRSITEI